MARWLQFRLSAALTLMLLSGVLVWLNTIQWHSFVRDREIVSRGWPYPFHVPISGTDDPMEVFWWNTIRPYIVNPMVWVLILVFALVLFEMIARYLSDQDRIEPQ